MKPLIVYFTIITFAAALVCQIAVAAEVTRVNASKGHVYVDRGKTAGFTVGAKVCIYSRSKEIACGSVFRTTNNFAVLRVDSHAARYIEHGMTAILSKDKDD